MDKLTINQYKSSFDAITQYIENEQHEQVEIWFARELQTVLGYARWENFVVAINRAVESCKTQGINVDDHFREVTKMVVLGSGAKREVNAHARLFLTVNGQTYGLPFFLRKGRTFCIRLISRSQFVIAVNCM